MKNWKAIIGVVLVFLLGTIAGGLVTAKVIQRRMQAIARGGPLAVENVIVRRLTLKLRLDPQQREQLRTIVRDGQAEVQPLKKEMEVVVDHAIVKVREILRPEQQATFDKLVVENRSRWRP